MISSSLTSRPRLSPDAVEDLAGGVDSDVDVGDDDVVEVASLLILEKCVRHPDFIRVRHSQVFDLTWKFTYIATQICPDIVV